VKLYRRLAAVTAAAGLTAASFAATAPAAEAQPVASAAPKVCKVTGFSPTTVKVGASPKKVRFKVKTSGCTVTSWSVGTSLFEATKANPTVTVNPTQLSGPEDVVVEADGAGGSSTEKTYLNGLRFKARTTFNTRTKAGPEPITKGKKITVQGQLVVADWKNGDYDGYTGQTVRVQFRTKNGSYKTVTTAKTGQYGVAQTTVTAKKSGVWRMKFSGTSIASAANARGDYVKVKK
jgi:hypothetical protein